MNLTKAIKDLQARVDGEFSIKGKDDCADMQLGIEALKFRQRWEQQEGEDDFTLLPGETKD